MLENSILMKQIRNWLNLTARFVHFTFYVCYYVATDKLLNSNNIHNKNTQVHNPFKAWIDSNHKTELNTNSLSQWRSVPLQRSFISICKASASSHLLKFHHESPRDADKTLPTIHNKNFTQIWYFVIPHRNWRDN